MTHLTGTRKRIVRRLTRELVLAAMVSGATITEINEAQHNVSHWLLRLALRPWEGETCPTCPRDMKKRGDQILRRRRTRRR